MRHKIYWKSFFFESNQFFDRIHNLSDWYRLKKAYPHLSDTQLLAAKEATYRGQLSIEERKKRANFGFRWEHDGEKTLLDYFKENGMSVDRCENCFNRSGMLVCQFDYKVLDDPNPYIFRHHLCPWCLASLNKFNKKHNWPLAKYVQWKPDEVVLQERSNLY